MALLCVMFALLTSQAAASMSIVRSHALEVEADGNVDRFKLDDVSTAQSILSQVEEMARSGFAKADEPKIQTIEKYVKELEEALMMTHGNAKKEVASNLKAVEKCNEDQAAAFSKIAAKTEVKVEKERQAHAQCREKEMETHADMFKKCTDLKTFLSELTSPEKTSDDDDAMVEYVQEMDKYWCPKGPEARKKENLCNKAKEDHQEDKAKCDKLQSQFELGFCTWRIELMDVCDAQTSCYDDAVKAWEKHKKTTTVLIEQWKTEIVALKKIKCYTGVWLSDNNANTVDAGQIAACQNNHFTEAREKMNIDFGKPVDKAVCSLEAVKNHPGTDAFVTTEYGKFLNNKQQFDGDNEHFINTPTACLGDETTAQVTTTTAPATTTTVQITTPAPGTGFDGPHIVNWMLQKSTQQQSRNLCGVALDADLDAKHAKGEASDYVTYKFSGKRNAGCGGACNGDNGINMKCHYKGKSHSRSELVGVNSFAKTYLISDTEKDVTLYLGSDDGIAVWLNGNSVFQKLNACHCYKDKQYSTKIHLKKGKNLLVVKIGERDGHMGFTAQLDSTDGIAALESA